ncbi:unnamed protein product, partial [Protopolystoma xenopodis]
MFLVHDLTLTFLLATLLEDFGNGGSRVLLLLTPTLYTEKEDAASFGGQYQLHDLYLDSPPTEQSAVYVQAESNANLPDANRPNLSRSVLPPVTFSLYVPDVTESDNSFCCDSLSNVTSTKMNSNENGSAKGTESSILSGLLTEDRLGFDALSTNHSDSEVLNVWIEPAIASKASTSMTNTEPLVGNIISQIKDLETADSLQRESADIMDDALFQEFHPPSSLPPIAITTSSTTIASTRSRSSGSLFSFPIGLGTPYLLSPTKIVRLAANLQQHVSTALTPSGGLQQVVPSSSANALSASR